MDKNMGQTPQTWSHEAVCGPDIKGEWRHLVAGLWNCMYTVTGGPGSAQIMKYISSLI